MRIDVESTGASSQFYDKFNIRYYISQILKNIWNNALHKKTMKAEAEKRTEHVRFINLIINDTTYLLDESLSKLTEIRSIQHEMDDPSWASKPMQQRQERESALRQYERQATSYLTLGNETVHMLKYLTSEIVEPFLRPEIIDRLAAMLDYNLVQLVGPKCTELKVTWYRLFLFSHILAQVKNPEKYHFQPKTLLGEIVDIFLNLGKRSEFVQAVGRDGRSYRKEYFEKAAGILQRNGIRGHDSVEALVKMVQEVEQSIKQTQTEEEELGEVPEEFMGTESTRLSSQLIVI